VLADGLALAAEMGPTAIIDVATLTGAAVVALGGSIGALFSNDPELRDALEGAGARAGEALWPLPLAEAYRDHIDSDIADMKNMGKPGQAGAIAAALLLERFVGETRWAHLDIAGRPEPPNRAATCQGRHRLLAAGTARVPRHLLDTRHPACGRRTPRLRPGVEGGRCQWRKRQRWSAGSPSRRTALTSFRAQSPCAGYRRLTHHPWRRTTSSKAGRSRSSEAER